MGGVTRMHRKEAAPAFTKKCGKKVGSGRSLQSFTSHIIASLSCSSAPKISLFSLLFSSLLSETPLLCNRFNITQDRFMDPADKADISPQFHIWSKIRDVLEGDPELNWEQC